MISRFKIVTILFCCILFNAFSCSSLDYNDNEILYLKDWEINVGNGWEKTMPVSWETPIGKGGIGAENHDGFGEYRAKFILPDYLKGKLISFYADCIDDSDIVFVNGKRVGQSGWFPSENISNIIDYIINSDYNVFRSATREARLYIIPNEYLNQQGKNELKIKVFDFSGMGGFCYLQSPVIGTYKYLTVKKKFHYYINDIPRTIFLTLLVLLFLVFMTKILQLREVFFSLKTGQIFVRYFIPYLLNFKTVSETDPDNKTFSDNEITVRYLLSAFGCVMSFLFLLSEVTYKYFFFEREMFWFKNTPIFFFLLLIVLISMFHMDAFGTIEYKNKKYFYYIFRNLFYIITHPFIILLFLFYFCITPPNKGWSIFLNYGLIYEFIIFFILGAVTGSNLYSESTKKVWSDYKKYFRLEGMSRLILIIGSCGIGFLWISGLTILFGYPFLIVNFLFVGYLFISILYLTNCKIKMPIKVIESNDLYIILITKYDFTDRQARIGCLASEGISLKEIGRLINLENANGEDSEKEEAGLIPAMEASSVLLPLC